MIKSISDIKNIAVCFGGEPRTYDMCAETINHFFNLPNIDVRFFAHTWTDNTFKVTKQPPGQFIVDAEKLDFDYVKQDLKKFFTFEKLKIEDKFKTLAVSEKDQAIIHDCNLDTEIYAVDWDHLFYSDLQSNLLKRNYELENNMIFDVVVKTRFDLSFDPKMTFLDLLNKKSYIKEKTIHSDICPFVADQYRVQMDDCFYYGSSFAIDLLQSNMFCYNRSLYCPNNIQEKTFNDPLSLVIAGPGVRLSNYCNKLGLNLYDQMAPYFIYRKIHRPENPMLNWQQIADESRKIY